MSDDRDMSSATAGGEPIRQRNRASVPWVLLRYGVAVLAVSAALLLKLLLVPLVAQETPFLLFFAAVMLAAAYGGLGPGLLATVIAALASDYFFMTPFYRLELADRVAWLRLVLFVIEGVIISILSARMKWAHGRAELNAERLRVMEHRVLETSEAEQQRIGRDLHDGLGQHLTGIAFLSRSLARRLEDKALPEAEAAREIEQLVNQAVGQTRDLASGLSPVAVEAGGLGAALQGLAERTERIFQLRCTFSCEGPVEIADGVGAANLYRIAQEAVNNAVKHSSAKRVDIHLAREDGRVMMSITDDGIGLPPPEQRGSGIGLQTMHYRSRLIGASLDIRRKGEGETVVTCVWSA